jgi:hypothetical protein
LLFYSSALRLFRKVCAGNKNKILENCPKNENATDYPIRPLAALEEMRTTFPFIENRKRADIPFLNALRQIGGRAKKRLAIEVE